MKLRIEKIASHLGITKSYSEKYGTMLSKKKCRMADVGAN